MSRAFLFRISGNKSSRKINSMKRLGLIFLSIKKIESELLKKLSNQQRLRTKNTCKKLLKIWSLKWNKVHKQGRLLLLSDQSNIEISTICWWWVIKGPAPVWDSDCSRPGPCFEPDKSFKCLRKGVHVGSRDVTNYSLLHCASIFADARALNTLIKAGSIFFQSYHFTPLNVSLLLYYRKQLDEILKIKIIPKVGYRFRLSGGSSAV